MTFVLDLCAMVLAQPRALFPALAYKVYGGGAGVVGLLQAAPAAGAIVAFLFSGWITKVRLQGLAIVIAVLVYGAAVGGVGLTDVLWIGRGVPGGLRAWPTWSARPTATPILQVAAPDHLRGRLQGVFIVVVAGGPRAGDFLAGLGRPAARGSRSRWCSAGRPASSGVLTAGALSRRFLEYDARHPTP